MSREKITVSLDKIILPSFHDFAEKSYEDGILDLVAKGGRNSSKSTTISLLMVVKRMEFKSHALVVRKVDKTLRKSCREQLIWAIEQLQVKGLWRYSKSMTGEMTLTYKPTGASIFFMGANHTANEDNIKSLKTSDMPITELWIEEMGDFKTEDSVTKIRNSILRAELPEGLHYKIYMSYNPPRQKANWVNKKYESAIQPPYTYVHHSTYKDNKYASEAFILEAEHTKKTNKRKYEWEYEGKPIGSGVEPFPNLTIREITDEEAGRFDSIIQGLDWGYAADPLAFVKMHYDRTRRKLYIFDEIYGVQISNWSLAEKLKEKGTHRKLTIADSAEPKSIDELRDYSVKIIGAKKGPGSVEYGEKWLGDLEEIIIGSKRCPNTAREFENADYDVDSNGNILPRLKDKDNHSIDAVRYGCEHAMKKTNRKR